MTDPDPLAEAQLHELVPAVIGILVEPETWADPEADGDPNADDTLDLFILCAHPDLSPASAVALTLRAVNGLTTKQIAAAYMVPESTMAQRISRAKSTIAGSRLNRPGDLSSVTTLYLVINEGCAERRGHRLSPRRR